ncbi:hypothetical protein ABPG74_017368 [Tetrahymena malaccensis]
MSSDSYDKKINTLFIGLGVHPYDKLLSVIDNPLTYETLIKHKFDRIIFQCPHKDYFKPLFHKPYENQIKVEIYGIEFPSDLYLYKSDVAITSCDVGVLLESNQVKINLIVVIEDTNSISYEIFTNLKEKPNVLGIKGAEIITNDLLDQYLTVKRDIQEVLMGGHKIPGEEYKPKRSDEKFQRQLMLLKQSLTEQNERYKNQEKHLATQHEIVKNNFKLQLEYLTYAFDSKKLNLNLVRHPQFQHLEPLLKKSDIFAFQREIFNDIKIEDEGLDFVNDDDSLNNQCNGHVNGFQKKQKSRPFRSDGEGNENGEEDNDDAKSNNSFDSFNSNQADNKRKAQRKKSGSKNEANEYTQPKTDENEEDYFSRIKKNYNPYFYLENQNLFDEEDAEEELKESEGSGNQTSEYDTSKKNVNKLSKTIKKQKQSYLQKVSKNKKLFNLDYSQIDPQIILKSQDPQRAQEVHIKKIERTNNELDELMSSIEKKEVVQMIKDEYETKIIKGSYRICNCPYCKRLMVPFLVRKDFEDCHQEINDMVLQKHKAYFEKVKQRYQINDINIEQINNIFFREYKTNYISVTIDPEKQDQQDDSFSEDNNDSPIKSRTNISARSRKGLKNSSNNLHKTEAEEANDIDEEDGEEEDYGMNGQMIVE